MKKIFVLFLAITLCRSSMLYSVTFLAPPGGLLLDGVRQYNYKTISIPRTILLELKLIESGKFKGRTHIPLDELEDKEIISDYQFNPDGYYAIVIPGARGYSKGFLFAPDHTKIMENIPLYSQLSYFNEFKKDYGIKFSMNRRHVIIRKNNNGDADAEVWDLVRRECVVNEVSARVRYGFDDDTGRFAYMASKTHLQVYDMSDFLQPKLVLNRKFKHPVYEDNTERGHEDNLRLLFRHDDSRYLVILDGYHEAFLYDLFTGEYLGQAHHFQLPPSIEVVFESDGRIIINKNDMLAPSATTTFSLKPIDQRIRLSLAGERICRTSL